MKRKKITSVILIVALIVLSMQLMVFANDGWNAGAKIDFKPASYDKQYEVPDWICGELNDLGLEAYEDLYENNYKWNVFVGPLRVYQNYLSVNDMQGLTSNGASISDFVDYTSLEPGTPRSEAEILVRLGVLTGVEEEDGMYMYMQNYVRRSEVAKILAVFYQKLFPEIQAVRGINDFEDTYDHWAKPYIDYCYERGLLDGKSETEFDPEGFMTKAESIRLLCNMVTGENSIMTQNVAKAINETYMCTTAYDEESTSSSNSQYTTNSAITPTKWYYSVFPNSTVNVEVKSGKSYNKLSFKALSSNIKITNTSSNSGKYVLNVKGVYEGVGFIECKYSNASSDSYETLYIPVFVKNNNTEKAKSIVANKTTLSLGIGEQYLLSNDVYVTPSSASYNGIYFSSTDPNVASVNYLTGQVIARSNGTCYIYAMTYNTSKKIQVTVSGYNYNYNYNGNYNYGYNYGTNYLNLSVNVGKTLKLKNYITISGNNTSYYSSNTSIATVTSSGVVTGRKVGTTQITVNTGYNQYIVYLSVTNNYYNNYYDEIQNIVLNSNEIDIWEDQECDMFDNMYIYPTYADTSNIRFSSEDTSIAKVGKKTGVVTGVSEGVTRIKIYSDNVTRYCTVYVGSRNNNSNNNNSNNNISVTDIVVNLANNSLSLSQNETYCLANYITVYPTNATDKQVYYSSNNENVVKVDSYGNITSISSGNATITVNAGNVKKQIYVSVTNSQQNSGNVSTQKNIQFLSKDTVSIGVGLDFNPYSLLNVTSGVTFTLSDYSVAKIENNRVIGIKKGEVTLIATYNGSSDTIQIVVK